MYRERNWVIIIIILRFKKYSILYSANLADLLNNGNNDVGVVTIGGVSGCCCCSCSDTVGIKISGGFSSKIFRNGCMSDINFGRRQGRYALFFCLS